MQAGFVGLGKMGRPMTQRLLGAGYTVHVFNRSRPAIDALIQQRAPLWPLAQMSAVDRNVLRIGLYESLFGNATVPLRTAINEAVELAKLFGSETSAKFVNGVLGRAVEASASGEGQPHAPGASDTRSHPATPA